jgi:hypothetical protein
LSALTELLGSNLAHPHFAGMPHYPFHALYLYRLSRKHGEIINPGGSSAAPCGTGVIASGPEPVAGGKTASATKNDL